MESTVREGQAPAVVVALQPGERMTAEAGAMMFVTGDISMEVEMPGGLVGVIVGYATQRYGRLRQPATR